MWNICYKSTLLNIIKHVVSLVSSVTPHVLFLRPFREKLKVVKPSRGTNDGPEAKKAKVDPNETTMVKKVGGK